MMQEHSTSSCIACQIHPQCNLQCPQQSHSLQQSCLQLGKLPLREGRALTRCFWQLGWSSRRHAGSALLENLVVSGACCRRKPLEALNSPCTTANLSSLYRRSGSTSALHAELSEP